MGKYCKDKDINQKIRSLIRIGWEFKRQSKHNHLVSPSGTKITVSRSPSDYRAFMNFTKDIANAT